MDYKNHIFVNVSIESNWLVSERSLLLAILSETSERRRKTCTVSARGAFGWTTFNVTVRRETLLIVHTKAGVYTTVNIAMKSLFSALQVVLGVTAAAHYDTA